MHRSARTSHRHDLKIVFQQSGEHVDNTNHTDNMENYSLTAAQDWINKKSPQMAWR